MDGLTERLNRLIEENAAGKYTVFAKKAGISHSTLQNYLKGRTPHTEHLLRIHHTFKVNLNWLIAGEGDPYIMEGKKDLDEDPTISELLEGARKVLKSGNSVAFDALERNIRYFSLAIETEKRLQRLETRMAQLEEDRGAAATMGARARDGDPPEVIEEVIKKRAM